MNASVRCAGRDGPARAVIAVVVAVIVTSVVIVAAGGSAGDFWSAMFAAR